MRNNKKICVAGGDLRSVYLAQLFSDEEYTVYAPCFEQRKEMGEKVITSVPLPQAVGESDVVILPLPVSNDNETLNAPFAQQAPLLCELFPRLDPNSLIVGGRITPEIRKLESHYGVEIKDYFARREFAVKNAIPTAEGAIMIAMEETPVTLHGSSCMITGFGKISKMLAKMLDGIGAKVTVVVRSWEDIAYIKGYGYEAEHISNLEKACAKCDLLFNTVPETILTHRILSNLKKDCLIIDLASKPGGVDFSTARALSLKTIWALSLPGKVAPLTAAKNIKETIENIFAERGM